jgi:RNA polymerase sigma-54 factor
VGARGLGECLVLQLRAHAAQPRRRRRLAITICEKHLELLARRDMKKPADRTDRRRREQLRAAQALIVRLRAQARPAVHRRRGNIIVPDVIVQRPAAAGRPC